MSEPLRTAQPEGPAPEAPPQPSTEEHAVQYAERAVGVERPEAPEAPAEPQRPATPPRLTEQQKAHRTFRESQKLRDLEAQNARLLQVLEGLERAREAAPATAPAADDDPEPDPQADPTSWYLWANRQSVRAMEEKLKPILSFVESQTEQQQRIWQGQQERARYEAGVTQLRAIATESEQQYFDADPVAANGYSDRLAWYRDALYYAHLQAGHSQDEAAGRVSRTFDNLVLEALRGGRNPAAYVDSFITGQILLHPSMAQGNGNGHGTPEAPRAVAPEHPEQAAIREMRQAAQSPVARSVSQSAAAKGDTATSARTLMRAGGKDAKMFEKAVRERIQQNPGMSRQAATFSLLREAEALAQKEAK